MVNKCCAVGCTSGYASNKESRETFHKFPLNNKDLLRQWCRRVSRENFVPTKNSRLCSKHFDDECFITSRTDCNLSRWKSLPAKLVKRRLKDDAVPTIFPNLPVYMTAAKVGGRSGTAKSAEREKKVAEALQKNIDLFLSQDKIECLDQVETKLKENSVPSGYHVLRENDCLLLIMMNTSMTVPKLTTVIIISNDLSVKVFFNDVLIDQNKYSHIVQHGSVKTISEVLNLMAEVKSWTSKATTVPWIGMAISCLESYTNLDDDSDPPLQRRICFLLEQLRLCCSAKHGRRYSAACLIFSYLLHAQSTSAYNELRRQEVLCIPSERTLNAITRKVGDHSHARAKDYLKLRFSKLKDYEEHVILMIDEIYVAHRVEYSGSQGKMLGLTSESEVCGTVLCFMIRSIAGSYRDVVAMYPIRTLTASKLHQCFLEVLECLHNIGFNVVLVSVDNHSANRSFFANILCGGKLETSVLNPITGKPLYLTFDPVHNVKNIYNNFQRKGTVECPKLDNDIIVTPFTANFQDIKDLYGLESMKPVKLAYKLSLKSLAPKNIEKTSVKLAMSIFHESTHHALQFYYNNCGKEWLGTANYIGLIIKLWNVLNVKSTTSGKHKRDASKSPVLSSNDWKLEFLNQFVQFLEEWSIKGNIGLTKETYTAVRHTCLALIDVSRYLIDCLGFKYVLLGKLQSDNIEGRFGWYRQLSGANYFISVKQLFDSEKKIRAISLLKFSGCTLTEISSSIKDSEETADSQNMHDTMNIVDKVQNMIVEPDLADSNAIYFIAGALVRSEIRQRHCFYCSELLVESAASPSLSQENFDVVNENVRAFIESVNRGGLVTPSNIAYFICLQCWSVFRTITSTKELERNFMQRKNHKLFFQTLMHYILNFDQTFSRLMDESLGCQNGHDFVASIVSRFFNCMMKNYVKGLSSVEPLRKKRKIQKLSGK